MKKNNIYLLAVFFISSSAIGQGFKFKAPLPPINKTGFYAIPFTVDMGSLVKTNYRDLRVTDNTGQQQAFVLMPIVTDEVTPDYIKLPIVSTDTNEKGKTTVVLNNEEKRELSYIDLVIRNAYVDRKVNMSGSDDGKNWFALMENVPLEKKYLTEEDRFLNRISFPLSGYKYFKVTVKNGSSDPLNIMEAGCYEDKQSVEHALYLNNPQVTFTQKDSSDRNSYIFIANENRHHINYISFKIKGPELFRRLVTVYAAGTLIDSFAIVSDTVFTRDIKTFNSKKWIIKIANGDNPPLHIKELNAGQKAMKMIAYLEEGKQYEVEMNSDSAAMPHYDLESFYYAIPNKQIVINANKIEPILQSAPAAAGKDYSKIWMWIGIIGGICILTFFTLKLTKNIEKKD
ncbi:hypothetical protein ACI6Q2_01720 [Chitinophagaceae bacterium LWZ2-11]